MTDEQNRSSNSKRVFEDDLDVKEAENKKSGEATKYLSLRPRRQIERKNYRELEEDEIFADNKTTKNQKKSKRNEDARRWHCSVLKLKDLYPQVRVPSVLHNLDLDPFILLTPFTNHDLFHGYQSEKINNDNKSVTTRASNIITYHRPNVSDEVHKIQEKNAGAQEKINEALYMCFVCQRCFRSHLDLETHVTIHLKHSDEYDTGIRHFENIIIKEEKIEIEEEVPESNEETISDAISAEDQSIIHHLPEIKTENSNEWIEDQREKNEVELIEKQIVYEIIKERDLTKTNPKEDTSTYLCAENRASSYIICDLKQLEKPIIYYSSKGCHKHFGQKWYLERHMISHTGVTPYSCNVCHKKFTQKSSLKTHSYIHTGVKPYSCNVYHKKFTQKGSLKTHSYIHTGEIRYSCNECHKDFRQKQYFEGHMISHTGVKPYSCNVCHKKFTKKSSLKTHSYLHSSEKPYSCKVCRKDFGQKHHLEHHMISHTGVKPYSCNVCHKKFTWKNSLKTHSYTHISEKPYSCKACHKDFGQKLNFEQHMISHTGVKPYSCNMCHKKFAWKSSLKRHFYSHTESNVFNKQYNVKKYFKQHMRPHMNAESQNDKGCKNKSKMLSKCNNYHNK